MDAFRCDCGFLIRVQFSAANVGYIVWDADVDASIDARRRDITSFLEALRSRQRDVWMRQFYEGTQESDWLSKSDVDVMENLFSKHDDYTNFVVRCKHCRRLHVQTTPGSGIFQTYLPDEP